jgi:hypothetical protein
VDVTAARSGDQLSVGRRVPEQVRQPRCLGVTVEAQLSGRVRVRFRGLDAEQELRRDQQAGQRKLQAGTKIPGLLRTACRDLQATIDLCASQRPPKQQLTVTFDDLPGTCVIRPLRIAWRAPDRTLVAEDLTGDRATQHEVLFEA